MKRIKRLLVVFIAAILSFTGTPLIYAVSSDCVYVSPNGSDGGTGSVLSPFATLEAAYSALPDGGTVVITGELSKDVTVLNASVTAKCKNTRRITITGKDPATGEVYENAVLPINSPRLYGELAVEHLTVAPVRNYAFFNTYGNHLIFGEGIDYKDYDLYIHSGTLGNMQALGSRLTINGGKINTAYIGGAFATDSSNGIYGNSYLTVNGGTVGNVYIGFDVSGTSNTTGTINGNVIIRQNGGIINKIMHRNLDGGAVNGFIAIITRDGFSANLQLPEAKDGVFFITVGTHGDIVETDTAGVFRLYPDDGYDAYVNGKSVASDEVVIPVGNSTVTFLKDTVPHDYEGALVDGFDDGTFCPDVLAERYDIAKAMVRCASDGKSDEDVNAVFNYLSERNALPLGWDTDSADLPVTKAEAVYMLNSLFDAHGHSTKLFDFADVPDSHIYAEAIRHAAGAGKISGRAGDMFFPDKEITRYEMCAMLARFFDRVSTESAESVFSDVDTDISGAVVAVTTDRNLGMWDFADGRYVIPDGGNTESYVKALYEQSAHLSPDAIREASDVIAKKVRDDILSTPNTRDIYDFDELGIETVYYVSEKNGSDLNNGLSPETPFRTPNVIRGKIQKQQNVAVLFERGGVYRTGSGTSPLNLAGSKNIVIGSYGTGQKPVVMQSRMNYANAKWTQVMPNVYRLETKLRNVGVIAFDHDVTDYSDATFEETFGEIENMDTQGFTGIGDLDTDLQFYCELQPTRSETQSVETVEGVTVTTSVVTESYDRFSEGYLYLYSEHGNPADRFESIEIGENYDLVDGAAHGCIIDNISFKFTGAHAIGLATSEDLTVKNCVFSWLGGSILWESEKVTTTVTRSDTTEPVITEKLTEATGYGNAVEIYGGCDGFYVCDNWIYQIFDDGITNQYHGYDDCIQKDMRYMGNLLEYVYHDFSNCNFSEEIIYESDFPTEGEGAYTDYTADLVVAYNICRMAGYGWGGPMKNRVINGQMYRSAGLGANKDELVAYNIFDSSGGYLIYTSPNANETYDSNIYIQSSGTRLIGRMQVGNFPFTSNAHRDIVYHVADTNAVAVLVNEDRITDCRKTEDAEFSFVGAQIRTQGNMALRFIFTISRETLCKLSETEYPENYADNDIGFGTVIMPSGLLGEKELKKNTIVVNPSSGVSRAKIAPAAKIYDETENEVFFTVCVTGISADRYNTDFVAVPYITYEDEGATVTTYGEPTDGISLFEIALLAYEDESYDAQAREYIYAHILSVVDPVSYPPIK